MAGCGRYRRSPDLGLSSAPRSTPASSAAGTRSSSLATHSSPAAASPRLSTSDRSRLTAAAGAASPRLSPMATSTRLRQSLVARTPLSGTPAVYALT